MENIKSTKQAFNQSPSRKYRQDLVELKQRAITMIDQMMVLDPNRDTGQKKALSKAQILIKKIQELCKEHLGSQEDQSSNLRIDDLQVTVEKVQDCQKQGVIGTFNTLVGIKDPNSFLIGTQAHGLVLMENGTEIFSGQLLGGDGLLHDVIHIPPLNSYFLALDRKLFRKDIDDKPAYLFMDVDCGWRTGACFRYSTLHQRVFILKDQKKISVLNCKTMKFEVNLKKTVGARIMDFRVFGENDSKVISATRDGYLILYSLLDEQRRGLIGSSKIKFLEGEFQISSIAASHINEYALVEVGGFNSSEVTSRILVFKLNVDALIKVAYIDVFRQKIGYKYALESCGSSGSHILWLGLSSGHNGITQIFDYDIEKNILKELEDKRVSHQEDFPSKLHRFKGKFYYTGQRGKLMSLSLGHC